MSDVEVPMGARSFKYFKEETVKKYAKEFGGETINAANMKDEDMRVIYCLVAFFYIYG